MTRYAATDAEDAVDARLLQHMADARAGKAPKPYVPPVDPLRRFIDQSFGKAPAETVDRGDDPAMSGAWLRLDDRAREDLRSESPTVRAAAERKLLAYADADPERDPIAAHFIEQAANAPRSTPQQPTPTNTPEEEARLRFGSEMNPYGGMAGVEYGQQRRAELTDEITRERYAAEAEEEAE